eukprot:scaffold7310_cov154-Skeletonema_dohrnii-CCMP3373.AAC.8
MITITIRALAAAAAAAAQAYIVLLLSGSAPSASAYSYYCNRQQCCWALRVNHWNFETFATAVMARTCVMLMLMLILLDAGQHSARRESQLTNQPTRGMCGGMMGGGTMDGGMMGGVASKRIIAVKPLGIAQSIPLS